MEENEKIYKTYGVVIAECNSGDYDKIITLITPDKGRISVFARGARRAKSPLLAATEPFTFSEFVLYKGNKMNYVNSAEVIDAFYNLRTDFDSLDIAFKICKIMNYITPENQNSANLLLLLVSTFNSLSRKDKTPEFIFTIYKARLLADLGYGFNILDESNKENKKQVIKEQKTKTQYHILYTKQNILKKLELLNEEEKFKAFSLYDFLNKEKDNLKILKKAEKIEKSLIKVPSKYAKNFKEKQSKSLKEKNTFFNKQKEYFEYNLRLNNMFKEDNILILQKNFVDVVNYVYNSEYPKIFSFTISEKLYIELEFLINKTFNKYIDINI